MQALENRVPPPIIAFVCAAAMVGFSVIGPEFAFNKAVQSLIMAALLISGLFFVISGILVFKRAATTINPLNPESASSLVVSGVYRFSRNPMYVGLALFLSALAVFLSSPWSCIGVLGFILYMNKFQIIPEEQALIKNFGSEFTDYQSKVRRWL